MKSGEIIECFSESCGEEFDELTIDIGAAMGRNAEFIIMYGEWAYYLTGLTSSYHSMIVLPNSPDSGYWWSIGRIAIDTANDRLAIIYKEGRIKVDAIGSNRMFDFELFNVIERGQENQYQTIHSAIFDSTGIWLAVARGGELKIHDVNGWYKPTIYRGQISSFKAMKFNPSGELLFVAADNEISIISTKEKRIIYKFAAPGISAIDISDDNRLLFWGDENGFMHVWGIPIPE